MTVYNVYVDVPDKRRAYCEVTAGSLDHAIEVAMKADWKLVKKFKIDLDQSEVRNAAYPTEIWTEPQSEGEHMQEWDQQEIAAAWERVKPKCEATRYHIRKRSK